MSTKNFTIGLVKQKTLLTTINYAKRYHHSSKETKREALQKRERATPGATKQIQIMEAHSRMKMYRYTTTDDSVQWLLARDLEHALWAASEFAGGTNNLKNVILDDYEW